MEEYLHNLINNNIYFFIFAVLIVDRLKRNAKRTIFGAWLANLHGTLLHELAHLFASILLNGKPTKISLFPSRVEGGYILGYVESSNLRWYNKFPIAMAPLVLLIAIFYVDQYFYVYMEDNLYSTLLYVFMIIGLLAFSAGTAAGVLMAKLMNKLSPKDKQINPLIGAAGVSAVPMAARVVSKVGQEYDKSNVLLMHAMGPNVAGVIGSAVAAGVLLSIF